MRLMERIRRHGDKGFKAFLLIFVISVFAGLGIGGFNLGGRPGQSGSVDVSAPAGAVLDPGAKDTALTVNGRKVSSRLFGERVLGYQQMMGGQNEDPLTMLMMYGYAAIGLTQEEVLLGKAAELGIKVSKQDIEEERQKIVEQMAVQEQTTTGNMLSDATKALGARRERKSLFNTALSRMGLSETEWESRISRDILQRKVREKLQEDLNAEVDVKAKATRDKIDAELAAGAEFAEMARKYSDAQDSAPQGGDMQSWLLPGLLPDDSNDQTLMAAQVGEMTPWFEVPAGYQRWQVYEREALEGDEYETAKERLTEQLRNQKDDQSYAPDDEELKPLAYKVKARQIMLNRTSPEALQDKINELNEAAVVEINNPYALAYQALYDTKLQPAAGTGFDQLLSIARKSHAADGYNFELIKGKLERGKPQAAGGEAPASTDTAADATGEAGAPEESAGDGGATAETAAGSETADSGVDAGTVDAATEGSDVVDESVPAVDTGDDNPSVSIYALAAGLVQLALEGDDPVGGAFGEGIVARLYIDWLENEANLKGQPLSRDAAREEIEKRLARAVESDNYNALYHAERGLNLAWLGRNEEAAASLELAEKYAPDQDGGPLAKIRQAYEKLDRQDKVDEIQARIDAARQKQIMEQIERAQAQQTAGGTAAPFNIDLGDMGSPIDLEALPESENSEGGE